MTPASTPRPQISPSEADRIRTHARSILGGEGRDEHDPALVEAVARAICEHEEYDPDGPHPEDLAEDRTDGFPMYVFYLGSARAALSTIRKHEEERA